MRKVTESYICDRCGCTIDYKRGSAKIFDVRWMSTGTNSSRSGSGSSIGKDFCSPCSESFYKWLREAQ